MNDFWTRLLDVWFDLFYAWVLVITTVGGADQQFAAEGKNYASLFPGCTISQTPKTQKGKT
jgi:hypothetical protein